MTIFRYVSVCLCVVIVVALFACKGTVVEAIRHALPQEQQFTELYVVEPSSLPKKLDTGTTAAFSYGITNKTRATQRYTVVVSVRAQQDVITEQRASVVVEPGGHAIRRVDLAIPSDRLPVTVFVTLPSQNQFVHFDVQKGDT